MDKTLAECQNDGKENTFHGKNLLGDSSCIFDWEIEGVVIAVIMTIHLQITKNI